MSVEVWGSIIPAMDPIVVTEYGMPMPGWYLGTRRKDGAYYVRINLDRRATRKWVRPSKVEFKDGMNEVFINKYTDLEKANV